MIAFGIGGATPKDRGAAVPLECKNCGNRGIWHYITSMKWFHVYFTPIFPSEKRHLLRCPVCPYALELNAQKAKCAKRMTRITASMMSGRIADEDYVLAVEAFWKDEVPRSAKRSPRKTPSLWLKGELPTNLSWSKSLTLQSRFFPFEDGAEGLTRRCPYCREPMGRQTIKCFSCGEKSGPWLFYEGRWWIGDWWLDEQKNEWVETS